MQTIPSPPRRGRALHCKRRFRQHRIVMTALVCSLALCGCAGSPREHFYTLTAVATRPEMAPPTVPATSRLSVGPVTIPEIVDRPQLVVRRGANQVEILEQHRWAQSLASDIAGVLAANLATLLPQAAVTTHDSLASAGADTRVGVDIVRFDAVPEEAVTVQARWTVRTARSVKDQLMSATLREPVHAPGGEALAAAFDRALARLSAEIADDLDQASIFSGR